MTLSLPSSCTDEAQMPRTHPKLGMRDLDRPAELWIYDALRQRVI